jgi:hypothetical protein
VLDREVEVEKLVKPSLEHGIQPFLREHERERSMVRVEVETPSSKVKAKFP